MPDDTPAQNATPELDPHPDNILGRGILKPTEEAKLLSEGLVFATYLTTEDGHRFLLCGKRPIAVVATEWAIEALRGTYTPKPTPEFA